ncbi:MAG: hypothetical protein EZS28_013589, partial [Streblomastix strix]
MLLIVALVTISFGWSFTNPLSFFSTKHKQTEKEAVFTSPTQVPFKNETFANQFSTLNLQRSFSKVRKMANIDITRLYYNDESIDQSGTVTVDYLKIVQDTYQTGRVKIADFVPLNKTASTTDQSFYVQRLFSYIRDLKTTQPLNRYERDCDIVYRARNTFIYGLYGYSVFSYANTDIAPSITGLVANGPSRIEFINVPPSETDDFFTNRTINKECSNQDYEDFFLSYALQSAGIYDTKCQSNEQVPSDGTKCHDGTDPISLLKGYQVGYFANLDEYAVKDLLIRFGAVYIYHYGLIVGWNGNNLISIYDRTEYDTFMSHPIQSIPIDGFVIFNKDKTYQNMEQCKSDTIPEDGCLCNAQYHPATCTCPPNPEDLKDLSTSLCQCLQYDDQREKCIICKDNSEIEQGSCKCGDNEHQPVGCICDKYGYDPNGCVCADQYDYYCVCNGEDDPKDCYQYCETGQFPSNDRCLCAIDDNTCKAGPQKCTDGTDQQPLPLGCNPGACIDKDQEYPCLCTGNKDIDRVDCLCVDNSIIKPGTCTCGNHLHHPYGCICANNTDWSCMCNDRNDNPQNCSTFCEIDEFPDKDNCYCREDDYVCKTGPNPCTGGTYDDPTPSGCNISQCIKKDQKYPCTCTGDKQVDRDDCYCKERSYEPASPGTCLCNNKYDHHPDGCVCADQYDYNCMCNDRDDNPYDCISYCTEGQFPDSDYCFCKPSDTVCNAGRQICTDGNESLPLPPGCKPGACKYKDQTYPCTCTGDKLIDREDCQCLGSYYDDDVDPGTCTCGDFYVNHPSGCACSGPDDYNCVCSYEDDPYYCLTICKEGEFPKNGDCLCAFDNDICNAGPKKCSGGTDQQPQPPGCEPDFCISPDQEYPCICTGEKDNDREKCQCSGFYNDVVDPGSCVCGEWPYHPNGCVCKDSEDYGCICNGEDDPYSCYPFCQVGEFPGKDYCYCREDDDVCNEGPKTCTGGPFDDPTPSGCNPGPCKDKDQEYPCTCTGDKEIDREDCQCSANSWENVNPGSCRCGNLKVNHPGGCTCSGPDDIGCVCSGDDDPFDCYLQCSEGQLPNYDYCFCGIDDYECIEGLKLCTEQSHPYRCECPYVPDDVANIPKRRCSCVYQDQREECQIGTIYYTVGEIDDNRVLELDYDKYDYYYQMPVDFAKITDFKPYKEGISASDSSFLSISKEDFEKLKLTKALTQDEINCEMVEQTREFYSSLGIIAKVMNDADIAPSVTYMVAVGPNKVTFINVPEEDKKFFKDIEISQSCFDENLYISLQIGLQITGISDSTCFPNTGIPSDITKCADGETSPEVYLQDYSVGGFEYADVQTVKQMLIRFGMVYSYDYGIILGWENNNWIVAEQESDTSYTWKTHTINEMNYEGSIFIKVEDKQPPVDCSDLSDKTKEECKCVDNDPRDECTVTVCKDPTTAPDEGCICTETNYPYKCICPKEPESLIKIPTDRCPCIDNDQRDQCKVTVCKDPTTAPDEGCICTETNYPYKCICPKEPESLIKIPTDRCP